MNNKAFYDANGYVVIEKAIQDNLLDKYEDLWMTNVSQKRDQRGNLEGWGDKHDVYLDHPEIMDILCHDSIAQTFIDLNKAVALHSNVTYFNSTEQGWHQDAAFVTLEASDNYQGAWVALEDVSIDAGPFEVIPGSHKWELDLSEIYINEPHKAGRTRDGVSTHDYFQKEIEKRNASVFTFEAKRGDAIIWHGHLVHRGSMPNNRDLTRKSIIGHYCNTFAHTSAKPEDREIYEDSESVRQTMKTQMKNIFGTWGDGLYFRSPH
jgi:ectoine hydroxylase-related dioxygenase (phytanoyl-CoA dioxygenase family)